MSAQPLLPGSRYKFRRASHAYFAPWLFAILMALSLEGNAAPLILGQDIAYSALKDASGQLALQDAVRALEGIAATEQQTFSRGYVQDTFWLKFELPSSAFGQQERWLELGPNFVDDIRLFYRQRGEKGPWLSRQTGDLLLGKADLDYRNPVFILPPAANGYDVLVRIRSTSAILLQARLWKPTEFLGHAARSTSFWSFYLGLAALSSLLALILALTLRIRLLWLLTAFSVPYLVVASVQGYLNWSFIGLQVPLQHYLTSPLILISYALLMWLCSETLDLRQRLLWAHKVLLTGCGLTLALLVLIPLGHYATAIKIKSVILIVTSSVFIYSVFHVWARDRFRPSLLLLGISPMVCTLASLSGILSTLGWIPFQDRIYVLWQYALVVNMLLVMAIAVYRVREKKLAEFEKRQLLNDLQAERDASFHQRQFIGMVSHEFRTPLAIISVTLENLYGLEEGVQNSRTSRYDKVLRATARLIQLTDNCLADARLAADALYLDLQPTCLRELIASAATLVQISDNHQLTLTLQGRPADTSQDYLVLADAALLRIALSNIIDNAMKYAREGSIHIDCSQQRQLTAIRICDQGPGIAEQLAGKIFERYRRGTHSIRGSGLGLYVARQIAQAHGGDLRLVKSSSQGSCFEITLRTGLRI